MTGERWSQVSTPDVLAQHMALLHAVDPAEFEQAVRLLSVLVDVRVRVLLPAAWRRAVARGRANSHVHACVGCMCVHQCCAVGPERTDQCMLSNCTMK